MEALRQTVQLSKVLNSSWQQQWQHVSLSNKQMPEQVPRYLHFALLLYLQHLPHLHLNHSSHLLSNRPVALLPHFKL